MPRLPKFSSRCFTLTAATVAVALGIAALPFTGSVTQLEIGLQSAHAKPGGNGKGKGGAGRGGEKASSSDRFAKKDGKGAAGRKPAGRALGYGKPRDGGQAGSRGVGPWKDGVSGIEPTELAGKGSRKKSDSGGISASALGSLNAAHASATARAKASPNSQVGRIAAYEGALAADDLQAAAEALASAANKEIDADVVAAVNGLLSLDVDPAIEAEVADRAEAARTGSDEVGEESAEEAF